MWVFAPEATYSTNAMQSPKRAIKILYQRTSQVSKLLEGDKVGMDDLELPDHILDTLRTDLEASTNVLPKAAQMLQDWRVGLLER